MRAGCAEKDLEQLTTAVFRKRDRDCRSHLKTLALSLRVLRCWMNWSQSPQLVPFFWGLMYALIFEVWHTDFGLCAAQDYWWWFSAALCMWNKRILNNQDRSHGLILVLKCWLWFLCLLQIYVYTVAKITEFKKISEQLFPFFHVTIGLSEQ